MQSRLYSFRRTQNTKQKTFKWGMEKRNKKRGGEEREHLKSIDNIKLKKKKKLHNQNFIW